MAAEIKAIWEGFSRFSRRELQLEPETVLSAWFLPPCPISMKLGCTRWCAAGSALLEEYEANLAKMWRRLIAHDAEA